MEITTSQKLIIAKSIPWGRIDTVMMVIVAVVVILMLLIPPFDSVFFREDTTATTAREFARRAALDQGELPLWNPIWSEPIHANPQARTLYPLTLISAGLSLPHMIILHAWAHLTLMFFALYWFLRHWHFDRLPSIAGAGVVSFSAYMIVRVTAGHMAPIPVRAFSILAIVYYAKLLHYHRWRDFLMTLCFAVMLVLVGHPQHSLVGFMLVGTFAIYYLINHHSRIEIWRFIKYTSLITIFLFGILAIQLLPSYEYLTLSSRFGEGLSLDFAAGLREFTPEMFPQIITTYLWYDLIPNTNIQETLMYTSMIVLALIVIAVVYAPKAYRPLVIYALAVLIGSLLFSAGRLTPLFGGLHHMLPMIQSPGRFLHWMVLPLSIFVALSIYTIKTKPSHIRAYLVIITTVVTLGGIGIIFYSIRNPEYLLGAKSSLVPGTVLVFVSVWILTVISHAILSQSWWVRVLTWVLIGDAIAHAMLLGLWLPEYSMIQRADTFIDDSYFACMSQFIDPDIGRLDENGDHWSLRSASSFGIHGIQPLSSHPRWTFDLKAVAHPLLRFNYRITDYNPGVDWQLVSTDCALDIYVRKERPIERVYAVNTVEAVPPEQSFEAVQNPDFQPLEKAIILDRDYDTIANPLSDKLLIYDAQITQDNFNKITINVTTSTSALVILSEPYYPGWIATVNDQPTPVFRVNHGVRGVLVGEGEQHIIFEYSPPQLWIGLAISSLSIILLLFISLITPIRSWLIDEQDYVDHI